MTRAYRASAFGLAAWLSALPHAASASFLWIGSGADNNWSTGANWDGGIAPTGPAADFGFSGSVRLAPVADGAGPYTLSSLIFTLDSGAHVLTGAGLDLQATGIANKGGSLQTIQNNIALQANSMFGTGAGGMTLDGIVSGGFGFNKTGASDLTLTGTNTYTGVTTISSGSLKLGNASALGTVAGGTSVVGTGAALNLNGITLGAAEALTLWGLGVNSTGALTNTGAAATYSGAVTIARGAGSVQSVQTTGASIGGTGDITLTGALGGDFTLRKVDANTLTLNGTSSRTSSNTIVEAGTLKLGNAGAIGSTAQTLTLSGGTLDLAIDSTVNAYNTTVSGASTITSSRDTAGAGVNHGLGTLSINGNILTVNTSTQVTSGTAGVTFGATTLTGNSTFNVVNGGAATTNLTLGALNGGGAARTLTKTGDGTLTLGTAATSLVNGTAINVTAGTLQSTHATALGTLANVTLSSGATFGVGASQTLGALNGTGANVTLGANTLTIGSTNNLDSSFNGIISGSGGITKAGTGTLTLAGNSNFTGVTTISAGTLKLGSAGSGTDTPLGTTFAGTSVTAGATLDLNGFTLATAEGLTLNGSGTRSAGGLINNGVDAAFSGGVVLGTTPSIGGTGNITLSGIVSGANALTKVGSNTLILTGANTNAGTVTITGGGITLSGANGALGSATGYTLNQGGTLTLDNSANNNTNRLATVALAANGGTFNFTHGADTGAYAETIGALTLNSGGLNLNLSASASGGSSVLTVASITRATGGTVLFTAPGLGASNDNAFVSTAALTGTSALSASSILPWAVLNNSGTYEVVTYNATGTTSMKALARTNTDQGSWTSAINTMNTADITLGGARTVGSVTLNDGIDILLSGTTDRTITFGNGTIGGLLLQTGGTSNISNNGNGEVVLGFGATEGFIAVMGTGVLTHEVGNGANLITGSSGVTKFGTGTYTIQGHAGNSGLLTINDGTWRAERYVATTNVTGHGAGADIIANKGTLQLAGDTSTTFGNSTTTVNGNFTLAADRVTSGTGAGITQTMEAVTLNNGATLTVTAGANVTTAPITLATGAITIGATDATITAASTLGNLTAASITGTNTNLTLSGVGNITSGAITIGSGALTKEGSGNVTLTAANTYTGGTTINAGTLTLSGSGRLNDTGAVTVNGGTFAIGAVSDTVGAVTLKSGTLSGGAGVLTGTSYVVQSGAVDMILGGSGITLTKTTAGTVTINSTNTYTGATSIEAGTLQIGLGGTAGALASTSAISNNSTLVFNRSDAVTANNTITGVGAITNIGSGALTLNGTISTGGTITQAGTNTLTLNGTNSGFTGALQVNAGGTVKISVAGADGLGSANTAGTTVASGGVLQLDNGATPSNGTLNISGTGISGGGALVGVATGNNRWAGNITLAGNTTITNNGSGGLALGTTSSLGNFRAENSAQTPIDTHTISLGSSPNTLTLNGSGAGTIFINGRLTGTGNIDVNMGTNAGAVEFDAYMNTFTGTTTITRGILSLKTMANNYPGDPAFVGFFGINGPLVIGDGHATNTAVFNSGLSSKAEQMNFTTDVSIKSNGTWNLSSTQTIDNLTMTGGAINLGASAGGLYLNNDVLINSAGTTATISGTGTSLFSLTQHQGGATSVPNATRTFNVVGNAGSHSDLTLDVTVNNGSIVKTGEGTMTILNSNSGGYGGTTTVNQGILNIRNAVSLGQGSNIDANATIVTGSGTTTTGGATVGTGLSNGSLQLQHATAMTVALEKLTLSGMGYANNGALQNIGGNNTWTGTVVLAGATRIQSDADTLTINSGTITGTGFDLDVRGIGNTTISSRLDSTGVLTKMGAGTLTLNSLDANGANTYTGHTYINEGVVSLQSNQGLGLTTAGTTVSANAALELNNTRNGNLSTDAEALTISGTGVGGTGALLSRLGSNQFGGQVSLAADALVTAIAGQTLKIGGGTSATTQTLTVGTTTENGNVEIKGNMVATGTGGLIKEGTGDLLLAKAATTLTSSLGGSLQLNNGTMTIGTAGANDTLLVSGGVSSKGIVDGLASNTTMTIASGATVTATYAATNTNFNGVLAGDGTFSAIGIADNAGITFGTTFTASNLTLKVGSTSVGSSDLNDYFKVSFGSGVGITVGTLEITGDTILDFGNGVNTLTSTNLIISNPNARIHVMNWTSLSDAWYVNSQITGSGGAFSHTANVFGGIPLSQITFQNYNGLTTTWVSGTAEGWLHNEIRPTPEPSTYGAILVSGCLGLLGWRRYRRQQVARK